MGDGMTQRRGTVRYDTISNRDAIVEGRGDKALWVSGNLIASGDQEDLPAVTEPWVEVSVREAA